mmetsp:Transcript_30701/g.99876  ORF Transcript_30701/g.99876 Transcript_30701/m.99876 type:complete len:352 (+) Transcript_30701:102-1157(+)
MIDCDSSGAAFNVVILGRRWARGDPMEGIGERVWVARHFADGEHGRGIKALRHLPSGGGVEHRKEPNLHRDPAVLTRHAVFVRRARGVVEGVRSLDPLAPQQQLSRGCERDGLNPNHVIWIGAEEGLFFDERFMQDTHRPDPVQKVRRIQLALLPVRVRSAQLEREERASRGEELGPADVPALPPRLAQACQAVPRVDRFRHALLVPAVPRRLRHPRGPRMPGVKIEVAEAREEGVNLAAYARHVPRVQPQALEAAVAQPIRHELTNHCRGVHDVPVVVMMIVVKGVAVLEPRVFQTVAAVFRLGRGARRLAVVVVAAVAVEGACLWVPAPVPAARAKHQPSPRFVVNNPG